MKGGDYMASIEALPTVSPDQARVIDGRKDPTHPQVRGKTKCEGPINGYRGIESAIAAEELQDADIEPGVVSVDISNKEPLAIYDPELEQGVDWV